MLRNVFRQRGRVGAGRQALRSAVGLGFESLEPRRLLALDHVVHISVDGLAAMLLQPLVEDTLVSGTGDYPNFARLQTQGASTYNARTDVTHTETLPNHTSMLTGRPVLKPDGQPNPVHHNWTHNGDPLPGQTLHNNHPDVPYIASVYDVTHDHGLSTALYASKTKFSIFDRSYDGQHGAVDQDSVGGDNGRDKIDAVEISANSTGLLSDFVTDLAARHFNYSFVHIVDPDRAGHADGWGSTEWNAAVQATDRYLGQIFQVVDNDPTLAGNTAIILSADHGGTGFNHGDPGNRNNYTVPFFVWGPGFAAGGDLYQVFSAATVDPGVGQPGYDAADQPIRNADGANLALALLGLPSVPGSTIDGLSEVGTGPDLVAGDDHFTVVARSTANVLTVLANDGPGSGELTILSSTPPNHGGTVAIDSRNGTLVYAPAPSFVGTETFTYTVGDGAGQATAVHATVIVEVISFTNARNHLDVDDNGTVSLRDALLVINRLRQMGGGSITDLLPQLVNDRALVDVNGDGYLALNDALPIFNYLPNNTFLAARVEPTFARGRLPSSAEGSWDRAVRGTAGNQGTTLWGSQPDLWDTTPAGNKGRTRKGM